MAVVEFTVPGAPISKARPRSGANGNTYTPRRTKDHEQLIAAHARRALGPGVRPREVPVGVAVEFYTSAKADCDNLAKTVLDGMNGVVYVDDELVEELFVRVHRRSPKGLLRTEIFVWELAAGAQTAAPSEKEPRRVRR